MMFKTSGVTAAYLLWACLITSDLFINSTQLYTNTVIVYFIVNTQTDSAVHVIGKNKFLLTWDRIRWTAYNRRFSTKHGEKPYL